MQLTGGSFPSRAGKIILQQDALSVTEQTTAAVKSALRNREDDVRVRESIESVGP